jgi:hypothetical protein
LFLGVGIAVALHFPNMKKYLFIALLGISTFANATSYTLFSSLSCYNNSYNCSLPIANVAPDQEISDCTFTFNTINTSFRSSLLYCNLVGNNSSCSIGSQTGSASTWNCSLDNNGLTYLNNCISTGSCGFNLGCYGGYNIGNCQVSYNCKPKTQNCPDSSTTAYLLGLGILGMELARRKFALAK